MLLFVGKEEKGYFAEEGYDVIYVDSNLHIEEQSAAILQNKEGISNIIYDIEQYADDPEEITKWVLKIQDALQVGSIILLPDIIRRAKLSKCFGKQVLKILFSLFICLIKKRI